MRLRTATVVPAGITEKDNKTTITTDMRSLPVGTRIVWVHVGNGLFLSDAESKIFPFGRDRIPLETAGEENTTKRGMCRKALRNHAGVVFFDRMKILPVVIFLPGCYTIAVK